MLLSAETEPEKIVDPLVIEFMMMSSCEMPRIEAILAVIVSELVEFRKSERALSNLKVKPALLRPKHCESLSLYPSAHDRQ